MQSAGRERAFEPRHIWADTTTPHGRLMLTVLGGLAEFERELIRARTSEGRKRAKARGVHMGNARMRKSLRGLCSNFSCARRQG
jgi:DNA invertase Pin-like site-specific DNA recombinase